MKITSIPVIFRNVKRWTEIISVLSRYGLADWLSHWNIDFVKDALRNRDGEILARHTRETRIRLALTDLGPTFIKLGQLLSTRPDVVGITLADELRQLQSNVPPDPASVIRESIESELGQTVGELFAWFDDAPLASASIGQVHRATLPNGQEVVVKVQRAGIERLIREDLEVIAGLAQMAEHVPEFVPYRPRATAAEMARTLRREQDFALEGRNLEQFAAIFADHPGIRVPKVYSEYCTSKILTMEWLDGVKLTHTQQLRAAGVDTQELARRGAEAYLDMIFTHGQYHADPHPGNILVMPGNVLALLDFGMVGRIDERLREDIESMVAAIVGRDVVMLTNLVKRIGTPPPNLDSAALSIDVADFADAYGSQTLRNFNLGGALNEFTEIVRRHQISLPATASLLIKTLVTLEGTAKLLDPNFSLVEVMQPFHRKMIMRRLSPVRQMRKLRRLYWELENLVEILPGRVMDILQQVQAGKFFVHLDHRGLEPSVNRLVLGMLTSALFLGSSLLLSQNTPPLLFAGESFWGLKDISILGMLGCVTSILMGLRVIRAITKSGHLDPRQR